MIMYQNIFRQIENRKSFRLTKTRRQIISDLQVHIFIIVFVKSIWMNSFDQLHVHVMTNGMLFNCQHDFRKHHSTESCALELTDKIRREIDQRKNPLPLYLDLANALDAFDNAMLFNTFQYNGWWFATLKWFKIYPSNAPQ